MVESRWNENDDIIIIIIIIINGQNKSFLFERILVIAMSELCVTAIQLGVYVCFLISSYLVGTSNVFIL